MKSKNKWSLKALLRDLENFTTQPERIAVHCDQRRKKILKELENPSKHLWKHTAPFIVDLGGLATWQTTVGAIAVCNGNTTGWSQVRLGFLYHTWKIRCRFALEDREKDNPKYKIRNPLFADIEPHCLAQAIATGEDAFAHGLGQKLLANFQSYEGGDAFFYHVPFRPLMLRLYALWTGADIPFRDDVPDPLGRYQQLIDNWQDAQAFHQSLLDACAYHCEQCFEDADMKHDFGWPPYDIFPVEILAIQRIRHDLGLPVLTIRHPLLESPLIHIPDMPPPVHDDFLDRVKAGIRTIFLQVGDPW